jgi:hypothetical protein
MPGIAAIPGVIGMEMQWAAVRRTCPSASPVAASTTTASARVAGHRPERRGAARDVRREHERDRQ